MTFPDDDLSFMELACQLAIQGQGLVEPNPMVGCVLVRDGQVLSTGFHQRYGGPHAERVALANLRGASAKGATAYVTLEPCCHQGKTPPCTEALIQSGIARVCCGCQDPNPLVRGKGFEALLQAGITVDVLSPASQKCAQIIAPFAKRVRTGLPFVIAKWAMSLDGKLATHTGDSRWISSAESRHHAHSIRGKMDAIIVGSRTAQIDDPLLTARPPGARTAVRVVVNASASIALTSQLVRTAKECPVLIWTGPDASREQVVQLQAHGCHVASAPKSENRLASLLQYLAVEYQATNVLCEGGGQLLGHFFDDGLIDEYQIYIAPKVIGGANAVSPLAGVGLEKVQLGPALDVCEQQSFGGDLFLRLRKQSQSL